MPSGIYKRGKINRSHKDPIERFMNFVEFEPNTGCWLWTGHCEKHGYGLFRVGLKSENTEGMVQAHRFSYEHFVGTIPEGSNVLHSCDNPPCVNWEHLSIGTQQNNCDDMFLKGRGTKSKKGLPYGVSLCKGSRFRSQIYHKGEYLYFGYFDTPEEAGEVALKKKLELIASDT